MTPDKIYLNTPKIQPELDNTTWDTQTYADCENVEYIRKDALLEWLRKEYETISWYYEKMKHVTGCVGDTSSSGKAEAYMQVIKKIESL